MKFISLLTLFLSVSLHHASAAPRFEFKEGEKVALLGDSFIEREQYAGWIELAATTQFPDRNVTFRNLGWSADTPAGDSRNGLSLLQAGLEPAGEGWSQLLKQLSEYKPDVIMLGYGTAASLPGGSDPEAFRANLTRLLDEAPKATGKETRFLFLGTTPRAENDRLAIEAILSETAVKRSIPFVSMDELAKNPALFQNPIHLTPDGYKAAEQQSHKGARVRLSIDGAAVDRVMQHGGRRRCCGCSLVAALNRVAIEPLGPEGCEASAGHEGYSAANHQER
jgi:hypothetical protein